METVGRGNEYGGKNKDKKRGKGEGTGRRFLGEQKLVLKKLLEEREGGRGAGHT